MRRQVGNQSSGLAQGKDVLPAYLTTQAPEQRPITVPCSPGMRLLHAEVILSTFVNMNSHKGLPRASEGWGGLPVRPY